MVLSHRNERIRAGYEPIYYCHVCKKDFFINNSDAFTLWCRLHCRLSRSFLMNIFFPGDAMPYAFADPADVREVETGLDGR